MLTRPSRAMIDVVIEEATGIDAALVPLAIETHDYLVAMER